MRRRVISQGEYTVKDQGNRFIPLLIRSPDSGVDPLAHSMQVMLSEQIQAH